MKSITPFLMFQGQCQAALDLYAEVFPTFDQLEIEHYDGTDGGEAGSVKLARIRVGAQELMLYDSPPVHTFGFTPSWSLFIECENEEELESLFVRLSADGEIMMPPDNYGFSARYTWISDRFGVSWQLNVA